MPDPMPQLRQRTTKSPLENEPPTVPRGGDWGTVVMPLGKVFAPCADLLVYDRFKTLTPIVDISPFGAVGSPDPGLQHFADADRVNSRARSELRKDLSDRLSSAEAHILLVDNSAALLPHREVNGRLYTVVPGESTDWMDWLSHAELPESWRYAGYWRDSLRTTAKRSARILARAIRSVDPRRFPVHLNRPRDRQTRRLRRRAAMSRQSPSWRRTRPSTRLPTSRIDVQQLSTGTESPGKICKLSAREFDDRLVATYDNFIAACLENFAPDQIVLVRSHLARFWVSSEGTIGPTTVDRRDARFIETIDSYFIERTGCRVLGGTMGVFPSGEQWQSFDFDLVRRTIEVELVEHLRSAVQGEPGDSPGGSATQAVPRTTAADHVIGAIRSDKPVDGTWLRQYFKSGGATYDDLLALAYLDDGPAAPGELVRWCVERVLADEDCAALAATKQRFLRSLGVLRQWQWCSVPGWRLRSRLGLGRHGWVPQVAFPVGDVVLRFFQDGSIGRTPISRVSPTELSSVVDGNLPITPRNVVDVLGSWRFYLQRARRGMTGAIQVVVSGSEDLLDTCAWLDWSDIFDCERVFITSKPADRAPEVSAATDLSFFFDPKIRICTVAGGLMDQVTHIAHFDELCRSLGLDYCIEDLRYKRWRSHNGFEASRLGPDVDHRRLSRRVSRYLIESFRVESTSSQLPWVFDQSRFWHDMGLSDTVVVTRNHPDVRRLVEIGPTFPLQIYVRREELRPLIADPPSLPCFFTTLQRSAMAPESAVALRRVFSLRNLEASGLGADVQRTARLLRGSPHVALHVRRGDYLQSQAYGEEWHSRQSHYADAIEFVVSSELGTSDIDVAVFSDDLEFVDAHRSHYGLDRVTGEVRFIRGNTHFNSIFDSYLMSLCPVIVGSVGHFASTTSLLADPPSVFVRATPDGVKLLWRR
jgi:hypothetical protein